MEQSAITFRRAVDEDYQSVEDLAIDLMHELPIEGKDEVFARNYMRQINGAGVLEKFVAVAGNEVVGTLAFVLGQEPWSGRSIGYEAFWYVKPEFRGSTGIKLLKYVEKNIECDIVDLGVYNPRLLQLLEKSGYTAIKTIVTKEL